MSRLSNLVGRIIHEIALPMLIGGTVCAEDHVIARAYACTIRMTIELELELAILLTGHERL
jgi:ABC-type tungstate transport system substrate-binding protein